MTINLGRDLSEQCGLSLSSEEYQREQMLDLKSGKAAQARRRQGNE